MLASRELTEERYMRPTVAEIVARLGLEPHPEGGWFRETYRSSEAVRTARGTRVASTAILFLVTVAAPSRFHRLASDELWVFQGGLPLELVTLDADGEAHVRVLADAAAGRDALPQALVPAGAWQAARVLGVSPAGGASVQGGASTAGSAWPAGRAWPAGGQAEGDGALGESPGERRWSLVSCVVTPGFEYEDFELAEREELTRECPAEAELIASLT